MAEAVKFNFTADISGFKSAMADAKTSNAEMSAAVSAQTKVMADGMATAVEGMKQKIAETSARLVQVTQTNSTKMKSALRSAMAGLADTADGQGEKIAAGLTSGFDKVENAVFNTLQNVASKLGLGELAALILKPIREIYDAMVKFTALSLHNTIFESGFWQRATDNMAAFADGTQSALQPTLDAFAYLKKGVSDSVDGWVTSIVLGLTGANTPIQGFTSALHAGVVAPFAPAIEAVGRWQLSIVQAWSTSDGVFSGISAVISAGLIKPMEGAILAISGWLDAVRSAWNAADSVLAGIGAATGRALTHPFNDSSAAVKAHGGDITRWSDTVRANMKSVGDSIDGVLKKKAGLVTEAPKDEAKQADPEAKPGRAGVDHLKNLLTNLETQAQLQEQVAATLGKSAGEAARYRAEVQALALLKKNNIDLTNEDRQALSMYINELGRATDATAQAKASYDLKNATESGIAARQLEVQMLGKTTAAQEQLRFSTAQYANLVRQGIPVTEEWTAKIEASSQAMGRAAEAADAAKQMHKQLLDYGQVVARGLEGAFSKWAEGSKVTVKEMVADMLKEMAKLAFKQGVMSLMGTGGGGGGIMGGLSSFLSGARADGGPVSGGSRYLVGERGPEIFQPSVSGSIIPNKAIGGGGGGGSNMSMNLGITINAQGSHPDAVSGMRTEIAQQIPSMVKRAVYEMMDRDARMARMGA